MVSAYLHNFVLSFLVYSMRMPTTIADSLGAHNLAHGRGTLYRKIFQMWKNISCINAQLHKSARHEWQGERVFGSWRVVARHVTLFDFFVF